MGVCALLASCSKVDNDPKVIVITFDGLRWQEVFTGADSALVSDPRFVKDPEALKAKYWKPTPEARREALMPFVWSHIALNGYLIGNRNKNSLMQGYTDGVSGNSMVGALSTEHSSWWGDDSVQLWRYGVMSFLLPRYLFMMQQSEEFRVEDYAQWTAYNDLPFDPDTGVLYGDGDVQRGWRAVRDNYSRSSGRDRWKIELIPSQAACARWMPNFERICACSKEQNFFGTDIRGKQDQDYLLSPYSVPTIYSPNKESTSQQYVLDCITVRDGWGRELFYYSPPPHQTYRVWSSGSDGMTFPPWTDLNTLNESERRIVLNWTKDDIAVMKN